MQEIISGRKDWDVVAFADYEHDMKENGDRVLALHQHYQQEIKELKRTMWWLVLAAGGKIAIRPEHTVHDLQDIEWQIEDNPVEMSKIFKAKIRKMFGEKNGR